MNSWKSGNGFSLIEILVVLGVMAILAALTGMALRAGDTGTRLRAAEQTAMSLIQATRAQAILRQSEARMVISADASEGMEEWGQVMGIIYRDLDTVGGESSKWRAVTGLNRLPRGVYFWEEKSDVGGTMSLDFPLNNAVEEGTGKMWFFFGFNEQGIFLHPGARIVFGYPHLEDVVDQPSDLAFGESTPIGGFVVQKLGAVWRPAETERLR